MRRRKAGLNLDRFKKSTGGLIELAILIEQADPKNVPQITAQVKEQDYDLCIRVMKKVVFFDELVFMDEGIMAEILSKTPPKIVAYALFGKPEDFREKFTRLLGLKERRLMKDEEEKMGDTPHESYVFGAQKQILKIARQLEAEHKFVFELTDCPRFRLEKKAG